MPRSNFRDLLEGCWVHLGGPACANPENISDIEIHLRDEIGDKEGLVVLHCDKDVPVEHLVNVAGIATSLEAKVTIATQPSKK